jgi:enamine deaminase RidA (YjgF/YER057c/UK114 family)
VIRTLSTVGLALLVLTVAPGAQSGARAVSPAVTAGGYVYVSTIAPAPRGADDVRAETREVLAELGRVLEGAGSSLGQLCAVTVTLKSADDFAAMNEAYRDVFAALPGAPAPPTRTTVVAWLRGDARVEISGIALPTGAPREALLPAGWAASPRPYSYIIRTDDLVFFSGLISRRGKDDVPVRGTIRQQFDTIIDNTAELLDAAGLDFTDIVSARVYLTSPLDFATMNEVYAETFTHDMPARSTGVVSLMTPEADIEVTFLASRQPKRVIGGQAAGLPVSAAVQSGPRVWLSGVIGDTDKHAKDVGAQTHDIFMRMRATLQQAGLSLGDVVDTAVLLRDSGDWPAVDAVFRDVFPSPPARTGLTARVAVDPGLIGVQVLAVRR